MPQDLTDKVAIVTGASSGIGRAIALALAAAGAQVVLAARSRDKLAEVEQTIRAQGGRALAVRADLTREPDVLALFVQVDRVLGRVDLLVNNAGIPTVAPADTMSLAAWQSTLDINLTAAFLCSREALKRMRVRECGRIINIGSVAAKTPRPNTVAYAATKAGLEGMNRALALEGRAYGVTVCLLHPGNTVTGFPVPGGAERKPEPAMDPADVARMAVTIAAMPDDVLVLETVMLPRLMPFLGRG
jgi:NAD(P)-dependent dehydrogenase (short-subunit alcohol dehydrogenase family)